MSKIQEVNVSEQEESLREMTAAEKAQLKQDIELQAAREAELAAKATAKAELLNRLGITEDEAKLLLA